MPALTHLSQDSLVGSSIIITKFVEWPVVDSVPDLDNTLYMGVIQIPLLGGTLSNVGNKRMSGMSVKSFLGSESSS